MDNNCGIIRATYGATLSNPVDRSRVANND